MTLIKDIETVPSYKDINISNFRVSDGRVKIDLLMPGETTVAGDKESAYQFGVSVVNDEISSGYFSLSDFFYRLICSNGAMQIRDRRSIFGRAFSAETLLLKMRSSFRSFDEYVKKFESINYPLMNYEMLEVASSIKKFGDEVMKNIVGFGRNKFIELRNSVNNDLKHKEKFTPEIPRITVFNKLTEFARDIAEEDENAKFEQIAGRLLAPKISSN
jgi:hypothetical protein